jgi:hypothetical protein
MKLGTTSTSYGSQAVFIGGNRLRLGWWKKAVKMDTPFHFSFRKRESNKGPIWLYLMLRIGRAQIDCKVWQISAQSR